MSVYILMICCTVEIKISREMKHEGIEGEQRYSSTQS